MSFDISINFYQGISMMTLLCDNLNSKKKKIEKSFLK